MLATDVKVVDINLEHWRRLAMVTESNRNARRLYVVHEDGVVQKCYDTEKGNKKLPVKKVEDPQALAEKLYAENPGPYEVQVVDPVAFAKSQAEVRKTFDSDLDVDEWLAKEWEGTRKASGLGIAPERGFLWNGLPLQRYQRFIEKMLPDSCTYVLAAFDGEDIWASLIVSFENRKIVLVTTFDALSQEDLKQVNGRDQHPFLISMVTNTFVKPAFGWFCDKEVLENFLAAGDEASMEEVFQRALMEKKATFDFNVLVQKGITPLAPINPGEGQSEE